VLPPSEFPARDAEAYSYAEVHNGEDDCAGILCIIVAAVITGVEAPGAGARATIACHVCCVVVMK
jgi:hypothetical protein